MPLDRGYVPLSVREWRNEACLRDSDPNRCSDTRAARPYRGKSFSLGTAMDRARHMFLLGDPGSGKTTTLRHIARSYAQAVPKKAGYPPEELVPVFVDLPKWVLQSEADADMDVLDAALAPLPVNDSVSTKNWLQARARAGDVIFLLDGFDEVSDPDHRAVLIDRIRHIGKEYGGARMIIASRIVGFDAPNLGGRFESFEVLDLKDDSILRFMEEWCSFRHGHPFKRSCAECVSKLKLLRHAIKDRPRIRELAGNPMMLTILCLVYEAGAALPQRRWQLFEKVCEAFLFSWQASKRHALPGAPDKGVELEDRETLWLLESLALKMQENDWTLITRWWLSQHVLGFLCDVLGYSREEAGSKADSLIWSLQARSGVIQERGPDQYSFTHLALQEHFAARAILAQDDPLRALQPYLYHPRWREVVRLAAAQLDRRRVPQLFRQILDDPDPTGRFLHRGLLLALGCLADGAPMHDSSLLAQLRGEIAELGRSRWLGFALEAIELLSELRSTRWEVFACECVDHLLNTADKTLGARDVYWLVCHAVMYGLRSASDPSENQLPAVDDKESAKPIREFKFQWRGETIKLILGRTPPRFEPEWAHGLIELLRTEDSKHVRSSSAEELGRFAGRQQVARRALVRALDEEQEPTVRSAIAMSLRTAAPQSDVHGKLINHLRNDPDNAVRGACASAVRLVAATDPGIRAELRELLESKNAPEIREGAARGLSRAAASDSVIQSSLVERISDTHEDEGVRIACLRSLESVLPSLSQGIETLCQLLAESMRARLSAVAALILAEYASSGRVEWAKLPIERIEQVLISVKDPCIHVLDALRGLVDAREARRMGMPREVRIARALDAIRDRVSSAFIFGSAARGDQGPDSDIDLMVIGDVSLRELTPGLRQAELELGRQVNAVVYSPVEWADRKRQAHPFIMQVLGDKRIPVIGGDGEPATVA